MNPLLCSFSIFFLGVCVLDGAPFALRWMVALCSKKQMGLSHPGRERERERDHGLEMLWYQSIVALVN